MSEPRVQGHLLSSQADFLCLVSAMGHALRSGHHFPLAGADLEGMWVELGLAVALQ